MILRQLPPRKIASQTVAPWMIAPWLIAPRTIAPEENCFRGKLPLGKLPPHHKTSTKNNSLHSSKFPSKSTTSEMRKTMRCLKNHSTKIYFSRL